MEVACNCVPTPDDMTFRISVSTSQNQGGPCEGSGVQMAELAATIAFQPDGNYEDDTSCTWVITCPNGDVPTFTFREFSTEADYDFVSIYDGADVASPQVAHLSGEINRLPGYDLSNAHSSVTFGGTSPSMTLQFTSDESVSAGGFEVIYSCGLTAPPPRRPGVQIL